MIPFGDQLSTPFDRLAALPDWQAAVLLVVGSAVLAVLVQLVGDRHVSRLTARIPGDVDDVVFGYVHLGIWVMILVGGPYLGLRRLGSLGAWPIPSAPRRSLSRS